MSRPLNVAHLGKGVNCKTLSDHLNNIRNYDFKKIRQANHLKPKTLLQNLLARGDVVTIENGKLALRPISGNPIPDEWLQQNQQPLINEIVSLTRTNALSYESYSTGRYGSHKAGGVTIQFSCFPDESTAYVIFNVDLTRARNTKHGKKGTALLNGQFRVGKRSHFYNLWQGTGLEIPFRLSSFFDCMGNLKNILFSGVFVKGERLRADSIRPINITCQQIKDAALNTTDKEQTTPQQLLDNILTTFSDKKMPESESVRAFQPNSTACRFNYGTSKQGSTDTRGNVTPCTTPHKAPIEQSSEEWLAAYESDE